MANKRKGDAAREYHRQTDDIRSEGSSRAFHPPLTRIVLAT